MTTQISGIKVGKENEFTSWDEVVEAINAITTLDSFKSVARGIVDSVKAGRITSISDADDERVGAAFLNQIVNNDALSSVYE